MVFRLEMEHKILSCHCMKMVMVSAVDKPLKILIKTSNTTEYIESDI